MKLVDLKVKDAISASNDCSSSYNGYNLLLGRGFCQDYALHLFFDLRMGQVYCSMQLEQAKLVLFKKPLNSISHCAPSDNNAYGLYPLLDFFNVYMCNFCAPAVDKSMEVLFENNSYLGYTEIDITDIVKAWITGDIENKGLLLMGIGDSPLMSYASSNFPVKGMQPFLRLIYDGECEHHSFKCIQSIVEVQSRNEESFLKDQQVMA